MASAGSSPLSPNRGAASKSTGDLAALQDRTDYDTEWTEEHETELTELKAKLKAAHRSWSSEQELYHERHDHLEDLKRRSKKHQQKAERKAVKLVRHKSEEGKEGARKLGGLLRRMSGSSTGRGRSSSGDPSRSTSESNLADLAPLTRTKTSSSIISKLHRFSFNNRKDRDKQH